MVMFARMKPTETVFMAKCINCGLQYGFASRTERDSYLAAWHADHQVTRTVESLTSH